MDIILASTSPYRQSVLSRLGIPFQAIDPEFTEILPESGLPPEELVMANATGKALSLRNRYPTALIIGSDQVGVLDREILLKPGSAARAEAQLMRLSGREHLLLTGLAVAAPPSGLVEKRLIASQMRMRDFSVQEAREYIRRDQPLDCAGAYKSELLGITLFESLGGGDPTAIIGLPLIALTEILNKLGCGPLTPPESEEGSG